MLARYVALSRRGKRPVSTSRRRRAGRKACTSKIKQNMPLFASPVILGPIGDKVDKKAVLEASFIRNRAVLEELAKH